MKFFFLLLFFSLTIPIESKVIVLYGTQCAGKTTLTQELIQALPGEVKVVKRTPIFLEYRMDYIEKHTGIRPADRSMLKEMEQQLPKKYRKGAGGRFKKHALPPTIAKIHAIAEETPWVIVDICVYKNQDLSLFEPLDPLFVHVYTPLEELLRRERIRTLELGRTAKAQTDCRKYILKGFQQLYKKGTKETAVGTLSKESLNTYWHACEFEYVDKDFLAIFHNTLKKFALHTDSNTYLALNYPADVVVDTSMHTVKEETEKIIRKLVDKRKGALGK